MQRYFDKKHSERKKPHMFSLNRQITKIVLTVWILFFATIAFFLAGNVLNYQEKRDDRIRVMLQSSVNRIMTSVDRTKTQTLRIFNRSKELYQMEHYVDNTGNLASLISLKKDIDEVYTILGKYDGIWVFYDNLNQMLYRIYDGMKVDEIEGLKADCRTILDMEKGGYGTHLLTYPEHIYYAVCYRRDRVAAAGMTELTSLLPEGEDYRFGVICNGRIYATGEEAPFYASDLPESAAGPVRVNGYVIYQQADPQQDLAVVAWKKDELWTHIRPVQLLSFGALFATVAPLLGFLHLLQKRLILPLRSMTDTMYRIQEGHFEGFQAETNVEEIEEVRKSIQTMTEEILNWQKRTYEEKLERQTIQMQYLQLQLGPHFYLNCLKNANAALMVRKYDYVQEYLFQVSDHLRYLMRDCMDFVTVEEELAFVSNYLSMMRLDGQCRISSEDGVTCARIPVLSIQLFLENSMKYATADPASLKIRVSIRRLVTEEGDFLNIVECTRKEFDRHCRETDQMQAMPMEERMKAVCEYIEMHLAEPLSRSDLAGMVFLSEDYFARVFKSVCGRGFKEYVMQCRMPGGALPAFHGKGSCTGGAEEGD